MVFFSLYLFRAFQIKKPQVFVLPVACGFGFYSLGKLAKKKPRGLEFARGLVTHLGVTKYQQAHSATVKRCHQQRQNDHEAFGSCKMHCS
jgi:hypothetical protein